MDDQKVREAMRVLGIDGGRLPLVALLPLVHVAWADGTIQPAERELILGLAERNGWLDNVGRTAIEDWLEDAPSPFWTRNATQVVRSLATRATEDSTLDPAQLVGWCWALANAAGGLFGTSMMSISGAEKEAIEEMASVLGVTEVPDWSTYTE